MHIISYRIQLKSVYDVSHFQPPPHHGKEENAWCKSPGLAWTLNPWISIFLTRLQGASFMVQQVKNPPAMRETQETWVWSLGQEDPLEEETAICSSIPAWKIPWREEPGWLQSRGSKRVEHDWLTKHTPKTTSSVKSGVLSILITIIYWLIK